MKEEEPSFIHGVDLMPVTYVRTVDHTIVTEALRATADRLSELQAAVDTEPSILGSDANWLEIYDVLDRVKDERHTVIRPAPLRLVDSYIRTRTWLREIHPRLRDNPKDRYGRRQLATLITRLERDLSQYATS